MWTKSSSKSVKEFRAMVIDKNTIQPKMVGKDAESVVSSTGESVQEKIVQAQMPHNVPRGQKYPGFVLKISLFEKIKTNLLKQKQAYSNWKLAKFNTKENSVFNKYLIQFLWAKFAVIEKVQLEEGKSRYYSDDFVCSLYRMVECPPTKMLYKRAINKKLIKFLWRGHNDFPGVLSAFSWEDINRMRLGEADAKHFWDFMGQEGVTRETALPENVKEEIKTLGEMLAHESGGLSCC